MSPVFKNGNVIGYIDRWGDESDDPDASIDVQLPCGFEVRFWLKGLRDEQYIANAEAIKRLEQKGNA